MFGEMFGCMNISFIAKELLTNYKALCRLNLIYSDSTYEDYQIINSFSLFRGQNKKLSNPVPRTDLFKLFSSIYS